MEPCSLKPAACITDHLCPVLGGRRRPEGNGWQAPCPICRGDLSIDVATKKPRLRIVWSCKAGNGCDGENVRQAMLALRPARIFERCIPYSRKDTSKVVDPSRALAELTAFLDELISAPRPGNEMRIRICQRIHGEDALEAADRLKIPERTAYRYRDTK